MDRLQSAFARVRHDAGRSYALLLVNVDHFKVFNETVGSKGGDHILTEIARRLTAELQQDDSGALDRSTAVSDGLLFRLGADEFTILLETVGDPSDVLRIARRMQAGWPRRSRWSRARSAPRPAWA